MPSSHKLCFILVKVPVQCQKHAMVWTVEGFKGELNQCSENLINLSFGGEGGKTAKAEIIYIYLHLEGGK